MLVDRRGTSLVQQVKDVLGQSIINGEYGSHNAVPSEAVLCEQFNISRSAIREAVKSLAAKGLLSSRARQGIRILPESEWNLFDMEVLGWIRESSPSFKLLLEFSVLRLAIEPAAARLAAELQNEEKITLIGDALERMKDAETHIEHALEADIAFHISILNASENRFFIQMGRIIDTILRSSITFTNRLQGVPVASYIEHKKVYIPIRNAQPEKATQAVSKLVLATAKLISQAATELQKK